MKQILFRRKRLLVSFLLLILCFVLVPSAFALEIFDDETVVIEAGEVIEDDLMIFANELILDGTVKGDVIAFVNKATINGVVDGDLMGAGQEIYLNGQVTDDVRFAGTVITLGEAAQLGDDVLIGAYSLGTKPGSLIEGDLYFGGAQSRLAGDISGNLVANGGGLELWGTVAGDVKADVGAASDRPAFSPFTFMPDAPDVPTFPWGLSFGEQAQIGGDLDYSSTTAVDVPSGVVSGDVAFEEVVITQAPVEEAPTPVDNTMNWLADQLRELAVLLLIGVFMVWLTPRWSNKVSGFVQDKPLPSLGWGVLTLALFIASFFVIFMLMVLLAMLFSALTLSSLTGVVVSVGLFLMFGLGVVFALTVGFLTKIIVAIAAGRYLLQRFSSNPEVNGYWAMGLGVLLVVILTAIPWIGPLLSFFIMLFGLGALWQEGREGWQHRLDWRVEDQPTDMKVKPA